MRCVSAERPILVGDPIAWFSARTVTGHAFELQVSAGRWVALCFMGSLEAPGAIGEFEPCWHSPNASTRIA